MALLAAAAMASGAANAGDDPPRDDSPRDDSPTDDPYDRARADHPDLFRIYYDEGVMEYCGLQTSHSMGGFLLLRDALLATRPMSGADSRAVRIAASIAVDMEFDNRGLGGQRLWCRTAGLDAYGRFVVDYWYQ